MFRMRGLRRFRRYFADELIKGSSSEKAADVAVTQVKADMRAILDHDTTLTQQTKDLKWADLLDVLSEWQALLKDVSCAFDIEKLPLLRAKLEADLLEGTSTIKSLG